MLHGPPGPEVAGGGGGGGSVQAAALLEVLSAPLEADQLQPGAHRRGEAGQHLVQKLDGRARVACRCRQVRGAGTGVMWGDIAEVVSFGSNVFQ